LLLPGGVAGAGVRVPGFAVGDDVVDVVPPVGFTLLGLAARLVLVLVVVVVVRVGVAGVVPVVRVAGTLPACVVVAGVAARAFGCTVPSARLVVVFWVRCCGVTVVLLVVVVRVRVVSVCAEARPKAISAASDKIIFFMALLFIFTTKLQQP
jgi:hypothetical protein